MIKVKLMDGSMKEIEDGSNGYSLATSISRKLAKEAVAAKVNGKLVDLSHELKESDQVEIITVDSEEGIEIIRHSTAHVMAQAVKRIYGNVKLAIGPTVKNGFYYDFDLDTPLTHGDIEKIEEEMNKIINEDLKFKRKDVSREEALKLMSEKGEDYKVQLINDLDESENISLYEQGDFTDLCRGPHVDTVKDLKYFKLLKFSGAYYKGDAKNKMLQRIYGVCFKSEEDLNKYLEELEEAKQSDHRK